MKYSGGNNPIFCRLYLTQINKTFECDVYFPNLQQFGETFSQSALIVENPCSYHLEDVTDADVDTNTTEEENGVQWRYRVMQFVRK